MAFAEDLSPFFATSDFAVAATLQGVPVTGIFDAEYIEPLGNLVEGRQPVFLAELATMPAVAQTQTLVIGATTYTVRGVEPDGTGVVLLRLEEA